MNHTNVKWNNWDDDAQIENHKTKNKQTDTNNIMSETAGADILAEVTPDRKMAENNPLPRKKY